MNLLHLLHQYLQENQLLPQKHLLLHLLLFLQELLHHYFLGADLREVYYLNQ
jgi:hypothetical protein